MKQLRPLFPTVSLALGLSLAAASASAQATQTTKPFEPVVSQPGKDVVWVPTPQVLVDKMLDLAKVTPQDIVIDLGSGDGRTVITAAKRGARAFGIEYNPDMVDLSKRAAEKEGVATRATFEKADIFEYDYSRATVLTLFLLPSLNERLRPTILKMKPGTRVVSNTFPMGDWEPDQRERIGAPSCESAWCEALFWIVPAQVEGQWRVGTNSLSLTQKYQMLTGNMGTTAISDGRMKGDEITFTAGGATYTGKVNGNTITGTSMMGGKSMPFTATRSGG